MVPYLRVRLGALLVALLAALLPAGAVPTISPQTVRQGGLVGVTHAVREGTPVEKAWVEFRGERFPCFAREGSVAGLVGVIAKTPPGKHTATLVVRYQDASEERFPLALTVKSASFPTQQIRMPRSKTGLMSDSILEKERKILYGAMEGTAAEPLWEGAFANPLPGRISSPFGRKRYVNGRFWGQHAGRDVASPAGRPVRATNTGRVLVAQKLWMRGNTVLVDHGMGLFSLYCHLSRLSVKPGQEVRKGEVVGLVGATGFVTGPHLHWELRIFRTPINPAGPLGAGIPLP